MRTALGHGQLVIQRSQASPLKRRVSSNISLGHLHRYLIEQKANNESIFSKQRISCVALNEEGLSSCHFYTELVMRKKTINYFFYSPHKERRDAPYVAGGV